MFEQKIAFSIVVFVQMRRFDFDFYVSTFILPAPSL